MLKLYESSILGLKMYLRNAKKFAYRIINAAWKRNAYENGVAKYENRMLNRDFPFVGIQLRKGS